MHKDHVNTHPNVLDVKRTRFWKTSSSVVNNVLFTTLEPPGGQWLWYSRFDSMPHVVNFARVNGHLAAMNFFFFWQIRHLHGSRTCAKLSSHVLTLGNMELRPRWGMKCVLRCLCDPSLWGMQSGKSERKTRVVVCPYCVHARLQCYRCAPFWNHVGQLRIIDSRLTSACPVSASSANLSHLPFPTPPVFGYFASSARTPLRQTATLWPTCEQESLPVQTNRRWRP